MLLERLDQLLQDSYTNSWLSDTCLAGWLHSFDVEMWASGLVLCFIFQPNFRYFNETLCARILKQDVIDDHS